MRPTQNVKEEEQEEEKEEEYQDSVRVTRAHEASGTWAVGVRSCCSYTNCIGKKGRRKERQGHLDYTVQQQLGDGTHGLGRSTRFAIYCMVQCAALS